MSNVGSFKPEANEYASYYGKYVQLVPEGNIIETLKNQMAQSISLLRAITPEQSDFRYAPDKWSIKQLLGHLIDTERIFAYRALRFARADETPLAGYDQDSYVQAGGFAHRDFMDMIEEFEHVRRANIHLLRSLDDVAWLRRGQANDTEFTVRALAYIMAGHELHHVQILREKYL